MYSKYRRWRTEGLREEDGIIVGADQTQEWLLPWWWENYCQHNYYPVTFFDFGMTEPMKDWCHAKGELIPLRIADIFVKEKEEVAHGQEWESRYGEQFWTARKGMFKKPFACLQSPYRRTIWIDLDCEIVGSIHPLFQACGSFGFAIAKDRTDLTYNSGVMAFQRNIPLIQEWADQTFEKNGDFPTDQHLLSKIIEEKRIFVFEIPPIYNWNVGYGLHPETVIYHWLGAIGKNVLRNRIILNDLWR